MSIKYKVILSLLLIFVLVLITGIQIININKSDLKNKYAGSTGELQSPIESNEPYARITLNGAQLDSDFIFGEDSELTVEMNNKKAEVTTHIRDTTGNLIGIIKNNKWWIIPNQSLISDKNFNNNTLEILNPKGDVIFQVRIIGNEVQVAGFIYRKNGTHAITLLPWLHEIDNLKKSLFKYPSSEYPGILNDQFK